MTDAPESRSEAGTDPAARIVDVAIALGEELGWDAVHLHDIAQRLGIGMAEIHAHFDQKDAIAEAWFDRADLALLAAPAAPGWAALTPRERLQRTILAWLDALAPHRRLTRAMLRYKFKPEHLHLQALGLARVSRTVQWIREAAQLPAVGWRREVEEAALTTIYLAAFGAWLRDESPGSTQTRALLDRLLAGAERAARWIGR
jgi:AcrR family transcriptional regulator